MAEIRDTLTLEIDQALRSIDQVERRLDTATEATVSVDPRSAQVLSSALETAERAARTLRDETEGVATAADRSERAYDGLGVALGVSADEAATLARQAREAALSASDVEREARRIADQMGLSENETRQFTQSLRRATGEAKDLDRAAERTNISFGRIRAGIVGLATGFLGLQAIEGTFRLASSALGAFSDSVEEASKAEVVFGDSVQSINEFVEDSAATLRASRTEAIQAAAAFGTFFTGLGIGQGEAAALSESTVQLAADLASFNNLEFGEALEKLRSGLAGETEPLRQLGAGFNVAELAAKGLELGLGGATGAMTEAEKAQARLALITERTASAQGDAARTADAFAGRLRSAQARLGELGPAFGEALLPAIEGLLDAAPELISDLGDLAPVVAELAEQFGELAPSIIEIAQGLPDASREAVGFGRFLRDSFQLGAAGVSAVSDGFEQLFSLVIGGRMDDFRANVEEGNESISRIGREIDNLQVDIALGKVQRGLQEGLEPASAFATAIRDLGTSAVLTEDDLANFASAADLSGLDPTTLNNLVATISQLGEETLGAENLQSVLDLLRDIRLAAPTTLGFADRDDIIGFDPTEVAEGLFTISNAADTAEPSLAGLRLTAEEVDRTFLEMTEDLAAAGENILGSLSGTDQINGALQIIGESAEGAAARYRSAFDLILEKTIETGEGVTESVATTAADIVGDLEQQAQDLANFQATIATLGLLGFDDLAVRLQEEGPAALDQALGFLDDTDLAARAERALEGQGVQIAEPIQNALRDAAEAADYSFFGTDVGLEFAGGIDSPVVIEAVESAADAAAIAAADSVMSSDVVERLVAAGELGGLGVAAGLASNAVLAAIDRAAAAVANAMDTDVRTYLDVQSPSKRLFKVGEFAGEGLVQGFQATANRRVPVLTGMQLPAGIGAGGVGGNVTINETVSNSVTLAGRDESFAAAIHAQQVGATGAALRGARLGTIRA